MNNKPELIIDYYGTKWWRLNGYLHREDGPAVENNNGYKAWYINGEKHRVDGPAVEFHDGRKAWYLNDKYFINKEEWFKALTPEQQYNYLWNLDE
jgi:hypothetical protein